MIRRNAALMVAIARMVGQGLLHQPDRSAAVVKAGVALREAEAVLYRVADIYAGYIRHELETTPEGIAANEAFVSACGIYQTKQAEVRDALAAWLPWLVGSGFSAIRTASIRPFQGNCSIPPYRRCGPVLRRVSWVSSEYCQFVMV